MKNLSNRFFQVSKFVPTIADYYFTDGFSVVSLYSEKLKTLSITVTNSFVLRRSREHQKSWYMSEIIRQSNLRAHVMRAYEKQTSEHTSFTLDELSKFKQQTALNKKLGKSNVPLFPSTRFELAKVLPSKEDIKEAHDGIYVIGRISNLCTALTYERRVMFSSKPKIHFSEDAANKELVRQTNETICPKPFEYAVFKLVSSVTVEEKVVTQRIPTIKKF